MTVLNAVLGLLVETLLWPFHRLPPIAGLTAVSLLASAGLLIAFKHLSRQDRMAALKRQMQAAIYEMRLLADDLPAIARAQKELLSCNLRYLALSFVPVLWVALPLGLLLAQLEMHYGYASPELGAPVVVTVQLRDAEPAGQGRTGSPGTRPSISLVAPEGIRVETPPLWIPSLGEVAWRITGHRPGAYALTIRMGDESVTKMVSITDHVVRRSPRRVTSGLVNQLLYPAERPLPDGVPIEAIEVSYPDRRVDVFGWPLPWLVVFIALTLVFAVALRKAFGVVL